METQALISLIEDRIRLNSETLSNQFFSKNNITDTKYFVLDNLLPDELATKIYEEFPSKEVFNFRSTFREKKFDFAKLNTLNTSLINNVANAFQSDEVINSIEKITNLTNLESDPSLYAGGISRMDMGHFLNPHIDNSHESTKKKYRRINALFYVTPNIIESNGGNFELWDKKIKEPLKIPSKFNRLIVMETNKDSWHSVDKVTSKVNRCCVSNYYYSDESPESYSYYHVTSFCGRPEEKFKRLYSMFDNIMRNTFTKITRISRGKQLMRKAK